MPDDSSMLPWLKISAVNVSKQHDLLTVTDMAIFLRTTPKAVYAMVERGQIPGIRRIGRRLLFRRSEVLKWLDHTCASSPKEYRR